MDRPLKVLIASAEVAPYAKVGGLADVAGALPKALKSQGHDVRVIVPRYGLIDPGKYGLTQVLGEFPVSLDDWTEQVSVNTALLGGIVPIYFVENAKYYNRDAVYGYPDDIERFLLFCRTVLEVPKRFGWQPDVIHCNDWHTAIIPYWLRSIYKDDPFYGNTAAVFTIHNLAYQGIVDGRYLDVARIDRGVYAAQHPTMPYTLNMMSLAILYSDVINTVSPTYAQEILTPEYGEGLQQLLQSRADRLFGIINGIDYEEFNPAADPRIVANYDVLTINKKTENKFALQQECSLPVDATVPLVGTVSRLADQKGFDLIAQAIDPLMKELNMQFVVLGTGEQKYHELFRQIGEKYPNKTGIFLKFDAALAQRVYAGSDMFLMPSRFEPCGLGQMISLRYGTVPIARATGGLVDTIRDFDPRTGEGNGFLFHIYDAHALSIAVARATESFRYPDTWHKLMRTGMTQDFSWGASAKKYADLYEKALSFRRGGVART
ncbi:MAG: glycogen synthase [Chloroflexi bacterium]|nr:glycogen synthase [Chloroflexota bacterium]MDA8188645.1 glycogen/starch synthase [Dehalococcoidales bacterium]